MQVPAAWRRLGVRQKRTLARSRQIRRLVKSSPSLPLDPLESAKVAKLRYVNDQTTPGIRRVGPQKRFRYIDPMDRPVSEAAELQRIRSLAIPPAWTDVWICPYANGHIQATGRDARGRKQYRYHPDWRQIRDEVKYGSLIRFAEALPRIRARARADVAEPGLSRNKVLATVVQLLEKTLIRVGNEEYARTNGSIGLTTMRDGHAKISGATIRFEFRGKSGIAHTVDLHDRRLAPIVKACRDLPGYELFQYIDENGERQVIDSADVNEYVREASGEDFTAKDFRTWAGTVLAARALAEIGRSRTTREAKRKIVAAVEQVAKRLGNTKAVCRKCYIHPAILDAYMDGATIQTIVATASRLRAANRLADEELAVARLIEQRLRRKTA
jgi:DNA topoisomerase-1